MSAVPLRDLPSSRSGDEGFGAVDIGYRDGDNDDPWQRSSLMPTDAEMQPLHAPSYNSRSSSRQHLYHTSLSDDEYPPWSPGVFARLPYSGLAALIGVLAFTGASVGVLVASNDVPIEEWQLARIKAQPQVWVSAFSTIANALLGYAFTEGMAICFWRNALRGTTLRTLHDLYESFSILPASSLVLRGRFNTVALASVAVTLCMVRGPIFQRASTVKFAQRDITGMATIDMATELPFTYFDNTTNRRSLWDNSLDFVADLRTIIQNATTLAPIVLRDTGCSGVCRALVKGSGFTTSCSHFVRALDFEEADMARAAQSMGCANTFGYNSSAVDGNITLCEETHLLADMEVFGFGYAELQRPAGINVTTVIKAKPGCRSRVVRRVCDLRQATVEYEVRLTNDSITLSRPNDGTRFLRGLSSVNGTMTVKIAAAERLSTSDFTADSLSSGNLVVLTDSSLVYDRFLAYPSPGTVRGGNWWARIFPMIYTPVQVSLKHGVRPNSLLFERYVDCRDGIDTFRFSNKRCNMSSPVLRDLNQEYIVDEPNPSDSKNAEESKCRIYWRDPMNELINGMREVAFRLSLHAASRTARNRTDLLAPLFLDNKLTSFPPNAPSPTTTTTNNLTRRADSTAGAALRAAADAWTQRVPFTGTKRVTVYRTDWTVLAVAAAVGLAGVLAVVPLYTGWWVLGRQPSLNPLEVGVAMGAPLLLSAPPAATDNDRSSGGTNGGGYGGGGVGRRVNTNAGRQRIVAQVGARRVRYGAVDAASVGGDAADATTRFKADGARTAQHQHLNQQQLRRPQLVAVGGSGYGNAAEGGRLRLTLADVEREQQRGVAVIPPRKGDRFD